MCRITDIETHLTRPAGQNLVVVRVLTDQPGLTGLGCATFTQRCLAVREAIDAYLKPLLIGRDPRRSNELWRLMHNNGYWRGGPVLMNAVSGIDQALWDIKGRLAGMPVYDLIGGRVREAAVVYQHVAGRDGADLLDRVQAVTSSGLTHVRVQIAAEPQAPGGALSAALAGYGGVGRSGAQVDNAPPGAYYDPASYQRDMIRALTHLRENLPPGVELIHDVHSRLTPTEAASFAKAVEPFGLFFLEDALSLGHLDWYPRLRSTTTTPLAVGELFTYRDQWLSLVTQHHIDFLRLHVSAVGGFTPAWEAAALCQAHGVRTAWHGPQDTSPIGHAAQLHLDLASYAFGVQEFAGFTESEHTVFTGLPELRGGHLYPSEQPGWGIAFDAAAAARYPIDTGVVDWTQARRLDGSLNDP